MSDNRGAACALPWFWYLLNVTRERHAGGTRGMRDGRATSAVEWRSYMLGFIGTVRDAFTDRQTVSEIVTDANGDPVIDKATGVALTKDHTRRVLYVVGSLRRVSLKGGVPVASSKPSPRSLVSDPAIALAIATLAYTPAGNDDKTLETFARVMGSSDRLSDADAPAIDRVCDAIVSYAKDHGGLRIAADAAPATARINR